MLLTQVLFYKILTIFVHDLNQNHLIVVNEIYFPPNLLFVYLTLPRKYYSKLSYYFSFESDHQKSQKKNGGVVKKKMLKRIAHHFREE